MALSFMFLLLQLVLLQVLFFLVYPGACYSRIPLLQSVSFHFFKILGMYYTFPGIFSLSLCWLFLSLNLLLVFPEKVFTQSL